MIFTRFGTPCTIIAVLPDEPTRGHGFVTPVDIFRHGEGGENRPFRTWAHELRADGGINEIVTEVTRIREAA